MAIDEQILMLHDSFLQLMRSQVQGHTGLHGDNLVSKTRTSKTGWLQDSFDPVLTSLTHRATYITKLHADTWNDESELMQVSIAFML